MNILSPDEAQLVRTLCTKMLKAQGTKEGWSGRNYYKSENDKQECIKDNWVPVSFSAKPS